MTDDELIQETNRGREAAELTGHPLMVLFFEDAERELWEAFKRSGVRDQEGREKIRLMLYWLTKFQEVMHNHIATGKMATMEFQERRTMADQAKAMMRSLNPWD